VGLSRWPVGGSEMAGLIRTYDWAATPIGPVEVWPQSLRTAVDTCLGSAFASYVWWGHDLIQIYNDAALNIMRAKHPAAFAAPAREAWSDVWEVVGPLVERVLGTGEPVLGEDMPMVPERGGPRELAYFTFSYSALRDEAGAVAGMFITAIETTERKRHEANAAFLTEISDDFSRLTTADEIMQTVGAKIGAFLGLSRCHFAEIDDAAGVGVITHDWHLEGLRSIATGQAHRIVDFFTDELYRATRAGEVIVVRDTLLDPRTDHEHSVALNIRSYITAPLVKDGQWRFMVSISNPVPRDWRDDEIELIRELAARIWLGLERARAEEALRRREDDLRLITDNVPALIGYCDREQRYRFVNAAFPAFLGVPREQVLGRTIREQVGERVYVRLRPHIEKALAGETVRFEDLEPDKHGPGLHSWTEENFIPRFAQDGTVEGFFVLAADITERKRAEEALRGSEEQLRLAVEAAGLGRWELVPETGEFYTSAICNCHLGLPADARPTHEGHFETIHPDDHEMIYHRLRRAVEESGEFEAEYRVLHPGGDVRRILSRARVLHNRGSGSDRLIGMTLDVTEARELEKENERARARELAALAEADERGRISRELHDRVAHHMGVAHQSLELHAALADSEPERAKVKLELAREMTRLALEQTRALSAELKRLQEDELEGGMEAAFRALLAESYVPDGVEVDLSFSGDESAIPKPVGMQVYLAMREAVRNAVRHSGCSRIGIALGVRDGEVCGRVEDDGEGFDPEAVGKATPSWGVGLRSMRQRAQMFGGSLRVDSRPGAGTRVELRVPLDGRQ
jgi:PAS domain S-box-containing protein